MKTTYASIGYEHC